jgi:hypothetical protein
MERDIWFMVAWMVGRHGAATPGIAEEMIERLRREHATRSSSIEESDIEAWLAIRDAAVKWLSANREASELVH